MTALRVSSVTLASSSAAAARSGLLGRITFVVEDALLIDCALRRTRAGQLTLSYPARRDRRGREHACVRPVDEAARVEIERQVFAALNLHAGEVP